MEDFFRFPPAKAVRYFMYRSGNECGRIDYAAAVHE